MQRGRSVAVLGLALFFAACSGSTPSDDLEVGKVRSAVGTAYEVSSAATCAALPTPGSWSGNVCNVSSDLSLSSGDSLTVRANFRLNMASGTTVNNNSGTITVEFGAGWTGGKLQNTNGATVSIAGFVNLSLNPVFNDAT